MRYRIWVDQEGLARRFDPTDYSVRVCTVEEAARAISLASRRAITAPIAQSVLDALLYESTTGESR